MEGQNRSLHGWWCQQHVGGAGCPRERESGPKPTVVGVKGGVPHKTESTVDTKCYLLELLNEGV